ncbi:lysophospholipase L1-like esterase [Kribbella orskensis]|uniref:Lysophospholipase L1-like esterase n=1 Tax=Kribbella orskensis TaxID=2512216 RepID=A0ABY2BRL7_9ACTN|nr:MULTISPECIES: SGNH/GDSL hydrolase family protein [Kribbella]TCN29323.1 lysophospholipase L1-like esterase [Kribbella sp. VKM Ac-2500]TCO28013.1 lysophospholipase L1-like esterase [Kribbella orskensis]
MRRIKHFAAALALLLVPIAPASAVTQSALSPDWVGSWAVAVTPPGTSGISATGVTDTTLRQVAHLSVGGPELRLRLSNAYGTAPLVVGKVTVTPRGDDLAGTPTVDPAPLVPVSFGGRTAVTIPVGAEWISDPVRITVPDDTDLVISTYFPGTTGKLTQHPAGYATGFSAAGDQTSGGGSEYQALPGMARYIIEGVDVKSRVGGSVVLFGDSITDGVVSPIDQNLRYPDQLADRLLAEPASRELGVLNAGISGNRLLSNAGTAGDSALARFDRDVAAQTGARTVVLLEGINDIGGSLGATDPADLIAVHRQFIQRAHQAGLKVIGATLTPFEGAGYYSAEGEADRQALNQWIRTSREYDGVVDFDKAVRDPAQPSKMLPAYDVGDHLHPNADGFKAMAAAFDLKALSR